MFLRLRSGLDPAAPSVGAVFSAVDAIVNPAAARAREELQARNERVVSTPSPGDRLLRDGLVVILRADGPDDGRPPEPAQR